MRKNSKHAWLMSMVIILAAPALGGQVLYDSNIGGPEDAARYWKLGISFDQRTMDRPASDKSILRLAKVKPQASRFSGEQVLGVAFDEPELSTLFCPEGYAFLVLLLEPLRLPDWTARTKLAITLVGRSYQGEVNLILRKSPGTLLYVPMGSVAFDGWKTLESPVFSAIPHMPWPGTDAVDLMGFQINREPGRLSELVLYLHDITMVP